MKDLKVFITVLLGSLLIVFGNLNNYYHSILLDYPDIVENTNKNYLKEILTISEKITEPIQNIKRHIFIEPNENIQTEQSINTTNISPHSNIQENENINEEPKTLKTEDPENGLLKPPLRFLLVGDSLVLHSFGSLTEAKIDSYDGFDCLREAHYSTGLNRIDYYNWYRRTDELINSYHPDVIIIFIGANDGQNIVANDGSIARWPSDKWNRVYQARVHRYLESFAPRVKKIYWIGHPIARTAEFQYKMSIMNNIYQKEIVNYNNVVYVDSWSRFAVNGEYSPMLEDSTGLRQFVKMSDGVHLTEHGGRILLEYLMTYLEKDIEFPDNIKQKSIKSSSEADINDNVSK